MSSSWEVTPFSRVAVLSRERESPEDISSDEPYIGLEHIQGDALRISGLGEGSEVTSTKSRFHSGEVLFGKLRPYFRKVVRPRFDGVCSTDIWVMRPAEGVDAGFLFYLVADPRFVNFVNSGATGTRMPRANWNHAGSYVVQLPPLTEQRAIGEVLGSIDDRIDWCQRVKAYLHDLGTTRLATVAAAEGVSIYRSLTQEQAAPLGEHLSVLESGSRPKGGVQGITAGVPSVGAESIVRVGEFDFSKTKHVPRDFFDKMRRGRVEDMDVLVYKDGGKPGVFLPHVSLAGSGYPFGEFAVNDHVYRVRVSPPYGQAFLYFWLSTPQGIEEMAKRGTGAAQPGLNQSNFKQIPIPRLPVSALADLEGELECFLRLILHYATEQRRLKDLRDTLLPRLLSGELGIAEPERLLGDVA